jgi:hypothetical protein
VDDFDDGNVECFGQLDIGRTGKKNLKQKNNMKVKVAVRRSERIEKIGKSKR